MDDDLDDLIRRMDPDRWLSSRFVGDAGLRGDVVALYAYDHELARAPRVASNPLLGEIRLTWWREALDEIYGAGPVRRHPTAQALAATVARHDLPRAPLEAMIDARYRELGGAAVDPVEAVEWARDTGGRAAELAARILDPATRAEAAAGAGALWMLARRAEATPGLRGAIDRLRPEARAAARGLSVAAFPAVAHAALAVRRPGNEVGRRLRLTFAVLRGRI